MRSIFFALPGVRKLRPFDIVSAWLPVLIGVLAIMCESTERFAGNHTSRILRPLWESLFGHTDDIRWEEIHFTIRKSGHFIGYGLLGVAWLRAWLIVRASAFEIWQASKWRIQAVISAVACTALVAGADEFHQTFLPGRTGQLSDVGLDTLGALTLIFLLSVVCRWIPNKTPDAL